MTLSQPAGTAGSTLPGGLRRLFKREPGSRQPSKANGRVAAAAVGLAITGDV